MALQGTQLRLTTAFKPSSDGQSERTNRFLITYLRAFIHPRQNDWDEHLALAEYAYNARPHSSIQMSPFLADLGYVPRSPSEQALAHEGPRSREAISFAEHQQSMRQLCQDAMFSTQQHMKYFYDANRPTIAFAVGDEVLLSTKNLSVAHAGAEGSRKFTSTYIGPYPITVIVGLDTYKLRLPPGLALHDEFHVSLLKKYQKDGNVRRVNVGPKLLTRTGEGLQVEAILKRRVRRGQTEYLVRWLGNAARPSWLLASDLMQAQNLVDDFEAGVRASENASNTAPDPARAALSNPPGSRRRSPRFSPPS